MKLFWGKLLTVKFGLLNMHGFEIKVKTRTKIQISLSSEMPDQSF